MIKISHLKRTAVATIIAGTAIVGLVGVAPAANARQAEHHTFCHNGNVYWSASNGTYGVIYGAC